MNASTSTRHLNAILLALAACLLTSCEPPTPGENIDSNFSKDDAFGTEIVEDEKPKPDGASQLEFPLRATISDKEGRTINVVMTGRTSDMVTFYREDDPGSKRFEYPIENLSGEDKAFVDRLPVGGNTSTETANASMSASSPVSDKDRSYEVAKLERRLGYLKDDVKRLDERLRDIESDIATAQTSSQKSALEKDRKRILLDIKDTTSEVEKTERELSASRRSGP